MERIQYAGFPKIRTTLNINLEWRIKLALLSHIAKLPMNQIIEILISQVELVDDADRNLWIGERMESGKSPSEIIKEYHHKLSVEP